MKDQNPHNTHKHYLGRSRLLRRGEYESVADPKVFQCFGDVEIAKFTLHEQVGNRLVRLASQRAVVPSGVEEVQSDALSSI